MCGSGNTSPDNHRMFDGYHPSVRDLDSRCLLPIVVGAHLDAELSDRALAYRLRGAIMEWQRGHAADRRLHPVVLTDLWYLNARELRVQPTVCIGGPEINAATAFHAARLPTALLVDDAYRIQLDPEGVETNACLWGTDPARTGEAVACFEERYLGEYLENAHLLAAG